MMMINWQELIQDVYESPEQLESVAEKFAQQLILDKAAMELQQKVSHLKLQ